MLRAHVLLTAASLSTGLPQQAMVETNGHHRTIGGGRCGIANPPSRDGLPSPEPRATRAPHTTLDCQSTQESCHG